MEVEDAGCFSQRELCCCVLKERKKKTEDMSGEVFEQKNELAMANLMIHLCLTWLRKRLLKAFGISCVIFMKENRCQTGSTSGEICTIWE